jgi:hypothetical protein
MTMQHDSMPAKKPPRSWTVPAETRLLATQVRMRDPKALARVFRALEKHNGAMSRAAEALGVAERTLYLWADSIPEIHDYARGRIGRPPVEDSVRNRVLGAAREWTTPAAIIEACGLKPTAVYPELSRLFSADKLERRGELGAYEYRAKGRATSSTPPARKRRRKAA